MSEFTAGMIPGAFTHYSYAASQRTELVCDLQGEYDIKENKFKLTDPCVLSEVGREKSGYGRTDRGVTGSVGDQDF